MVNEKGFLGTLLISYRMPDAVEGSVISGLGSFFFFFFRVAFFAFLFPLIVAACTKIPPENIH
jgi:hypothetical protein